MWKDDRLPAEPGPLNCGFAYCAIFWTVPDFPTSLHLSLRLHFLRQRKPAVSDILPTVLRHLLFLTFGIQFSIFFSHNQISSVCFPPMTIYFHVLFRAHCWFWEFFFLFRWSRFLCLVNFCYRCYLFLIKASQFPFLIQHFIRKGVFESAHWLNNLVNISIFAVQ